MDYIEGAIEFKNILFREKR